MIKKRSLILTLFLSFCLLAVSAQKKIIILTGDDLNHASGTHEFYAGGLLLKDAFQNSNVENLVTIEVVNNWDGDPSKVEGAAAIMHYYKGNTASFICQGENEKTIDKLISAGVGQLFVHYAVDPCDEAEAAMKAWTGGVYQEKFSSNPHWPLKAQLENHPINTGLKPFSIVDEWYMNIEYEKGEAKTDYEKPNLAEQVYSVMHGELAQFQKGKLKKGWKDRNDLSHSDLTVVWAKEREDGGRGIGFTGAHFHKNWAHDEFRKQIMNAILWAAHLEIPTEGVTSPTVTEEMINANLDDRKKGGLKKITLASTPAAQKKKNSAVTPPSGKVSAPPAKKKKTPKAPKKGGDPYANKKKIGSVINTIHPYFSLENINTLDAAELKVGGMCFHEEDLYIVTLSPDRTNKAPDHKGQLIRLENALAVTPGGKEKLKKTVLVENLYEPTGVQLVGGSIYIGTKTQILRYDDGATSEKTLQPTDLTVMIDGLSTVNFHTYTIGFEPLEKDGDLYLCGNFTTAILMGGKRDKMTPPNPKVHRGSTFYFGPVTGKEAPEDVKLDYLAGGFRTPNGIEVGPENEVYVADNQGIFNPSNELVRVEPGSFYGHYLYTEGGRAAAFQPENLNPETGGASGQKGATVHLPQGTVARSPAQPHVIHGRNGVLAPYNGQLLLSEFTSGSILRVFTEEVEGVWQGVAFLHSGGPADKEGNNGFTGGPNRLLEGPDGHYYIGQIGAGRLWSYNDALDGLQRLRVKAQSELPEGFNEILAVRVVDGGFEVEFLHPLPAETLSAETITVEQNTYIPTSSYGGTPVGIEKLKVKSISWKENGKKAVLRIDGLKDSSEKYLHKKGAYTSHNTGYVVHLTLGGKATAALYSDQFWYTLHKKIGGADLAADEIITATAEELTKKKFESLCLACHANIAGAPELTGLLGRTQQVIMEDGSEKEVTVDRDYIINAILKPNSEKSVKYKDVIMAQLVTEKKEAESLADYIIQLK